MYGNIVIIDKALIDVTNLNRNLMADTKVVGKYKVDVAKKKLLNINPELNIKIIKEYVSKDNSSKLITDDFDYIVDTIDSIHDKLSLISEAVHKDIPIISSMGTGDKFENKCSKMQIAKNCNNKCNNLTTQSAHINVQIFFILSNRC